MLVHDFVVINCELNSIALYKILGKRGLKKQNLVTNFLVSLYYTCKELIDHNQKERGLVCYGKLFSIRQPQSTNINKPSWKP